MDGVAKSATTVLGTEAAAAFRFRLTNNRLNLLARSASLPDQWRRLAAGSHADMDLFQIGLKAFAPFDFAVLSETIGTGSLQHLNNYPEYARFPLDDAFALQARDEGGSGLIVAARVRLQKLNPGRRDRLKKLAVHLRAGNRLRVHRAHVDAVLDPLGRTHHAEEAAQPRRARNLLGGAVRAIERARRERTAEALNAWHALWDGRWTLVDRFDSDGKRWLLAKRNAPQSNLPEALQPRERDIVEQIVRGQSLKLVAYELGLPIGTVAASLKRAMVKLRVKSRGELTALVSPLLHEER